jgi:nitroimidazol reductase NimA-like FMN-containing flavoprotein (pyridoxamine 5'-phosphate oxidase superfamily)
MNVQEMTEHECRAMLAATDVARLACARDNQPYIVPIHLHLDDEFLYGYTTLGQHVEWMRLNPLVCVEADAVVTHAQWESVIVFGRFEELPDTPPYQEWRRLAERLFQQRPMWWEPASVPLAAHHPRAPIVFRIRIGSVAGRRAASEIAAARSPQASRPEAGRAGRVADLVRRMLRPESPPRR